MSSFQTEYITKILGLRCTLNWGKKLAIFLAEQYLEIVALGFDFSRLKTENRVTSSFALNCLNFCMGPSLLSKNIAQSFFSDLPYVHTLAMHTLLGANQQIIKPPKLLTWDGCSALSRARHQQWFAGHWPVEIWNSWPFWPGENFFEEFTWLILNYLCTLLRELLKWKTFSKLWCYILKTSSSRISTMLTGLVLKSCWSVSFITV